MRHGATGAAAGYSVVMTEDSQPPRAHAPGTGTHAAEVEEVDGFDRGDAGALPSVETAVPPPVVRAVGDV